jgi:hypothetical protein
MVIDENGNVLKYRSYGLDTNSGLTMAPQGRLGKILWINWGSPPLYGIMRSSVLRKTRLLGSTYAADQILLAELALHGRFYEVPEDLLLHREHTNRSVHSNPSRHALAIFQDPSNAGRVIFPAWRVLRDYLAAIRRAPLSRPERFECGVHMLRWVKYHRAEMIEDMVIAMKQILGASKTGQVSA